MPFIFQPIREELQRAVRENASFIGGDVLDVGAGSHDRYSSLLTFKSFTRMDIPGVPNIQIEGGAEDIPVADASYDSILSTQALGYVWDVEKAFAEFNRVLKPGGTLLLTAGFLDPLTGDETDTWRFTAYAYRKLCEGSGFEVLNLRPIGGIWSLRAQFTIRYWIIKLDAYNKPYWKLIHWWAKAYGSFMMWRDTQDRQSYRDTFAHGHILVAKKIV